MGGRRAWLALVALAILATGCEGAVDPAENPFQCVGLPTATCERFLAEAQRSVPNSAPVSALITCTAVCTEAKGDAMVQVLFANGERIEYGTAWEQAVGGGGVDPAEPAPDPPVPGTTPGTESPGS